MFLPNVDLTNKIILVTGAAGFIGSNLVMELLKTVEPVTIVGLDNMNDYYDVSIKEYRLEQINKLAAEHPASHWEFIKGNIADKALIEDLFTKYNFAVVAPMPHLRARHWMLIVILSVSAVAGSLITPRGIPIS